MPALTPAQAATYAQVSEALDEEGYGDLLKGQPVDVHDAVAQMRLDAEQMTARAEQLEQLLSDADAKAAVARSKVDD